MGIKLRMVDLGIKLAFTFCKMNENVYFLSKVISIFTGMCAKNRNVTSKKVYVVKYMVMNKCRITRLFKFS